MKFEVEFKWKEEIKYLASMIDRYDIPELDILFKNYVVEKVQSEGMSLDTNLQCWFIYDNHNEIMNTLIYNMLNDFVDGELLVTSDKDIDYGMVGSIITRACMTLSIEDYLTYGDAGGLMHYCNFTKYDANISIGDFIAKNLENLLLGIFYGIDANMYRRNIYKSPIEVTILQKVED